MTPLPPLPAHIQALFNQAQAAFTALLASSPAQEHHDAISAWMAQTLASMGAVPRSEFERQRDLLLNLQERVNQLENLLRHQS